MVIARCVFCQRGYKFFALTTRGLQCVSNPLLDLYKGGKYSVFERNIQEMLEQNQIAEHVMSTSGSSWHVCLTRIKLNSRNLAQILAQSSPMFLDI